MKYGISTLVAAILLMILAVSAGIAIYVYTSSSFGFNHQSQNVTEVQGKVTGYYYFYMENMRDAPLLTLLVTDPILGQVAVSVPNNLKITPHLGDNIIAKINGFGTEENYIVSIMIVTGEFIHE